MASNSIVFENPHTAHIRTAPVGFSWTTLFFGFFVPLLRSDWKWAVIMLIASVVTMGLSNLFFPFVYNKFYIKDLASNGFLVKSIALGTVDQLSVSLGVALKGVEAAAA